MKTVFFRCNADEESGLGHFSRCLNVARGILSNYNPIVVTFYGSFNSFAVGLLHKYKINYHDVELNKQWDIDYNRNLANQCDYFIVDTYLLNRDFFIGIKNENFKLTAFDDFMTYDTPSLDLIINFCIQAENRFKYKNRNTALDLDFFPAKPELKKIRIERMERTPTKIQDILVMMGGKDEFEIGVKIIEPIQQILLDSKIKIVTNIKINVENKNVTVFPFSSEVEQFYSDADLVIHGGGLTKYESAYCLIPNISIALTDKIQLDTDFFSLENLCFDAGTAENFNVEKFSKTLSSSLNQNNISKFLDSASKKIKTDSLENLTMRIIE